MDLISEVEISYFRSFYKFKIINCNELNIVFGKNDVGKSNLVRALNLFFAGKPDSFSEFDFPIDFSEQRRRESDESEDIRKFLYVKITFNTPPSYQRSLGKSFYIKRQWTVSRGSDYNEEISGTIPNSRRHIVSRFVNKIRFIYIPAIKDIRIFEMLLSGIHEAIAASDKFKESIDRFSEELQSLTKEMFHKLPKDVSSSTKIGAPTQLSQLFQTLDFETIADGESSPKSLTRQRGDGIKVRHIPELLNFISEKDDYEFHIWGFEEPENSLDFVSAEAEARRILNIAKGAKVQIFVTTHSPSFYLLEDEAISKFYVSKDKRGSSSAIQGKELKKMKIEEAIGEGFYLPAVAEAVKNIADIQMRAKIAEEKSEVLRKELENITTPVVLTEGRTDAKILITAWEKLRGGIPPFRIRSCETGGEAAGSGNGGAQSLAVRLKAVASDHPHAVIGLFDYDDQGFSAYQLDRNFVEDKIGGYRVKRGMHGKSYAALLIPPDFRKDCEKFKNCPIEFMFRDECLGTQRNGFSLNLKIKAASIKIGDQKIEKVLDDYTHFKEIVGGKVDFAEKIVPTFGPECFDAFAALFQMIEALIEHSTALAPE